MSGKIEIDELGAADYSAWERFVAGAAGGSVYALPRYLEVLCGVTDASLRVVAASRGGELVGGAALYERKSLAGSYVAPRLLLYYNGPVLAQGTSRYPSERTSLRLKVVSALTDWIDRQRYAHVCFRSRSDLVDVRPFLGRGWSTHPDYSYEVSITDTAAAWDRVENNFRRLVRRCEREGLQLVSDTDFETFYALHRAVHERKSAPLYLPRDRFRTYWEELHRRDLARLYHVRLPDGTTAASQLVLRGPHPITHTVCAGATVEHLSSGASVFLRWKVLESLADEGYEGNDLTDAALGRVTHFKSQLGGDLKLSLVVTRPPSTAWRVRQSGQYATRFATRAVSFAARRLRRAGS